MSHSEFLAKPPLIEARRLKFSRNDESIFSPMTFTLYPGEVLLIEGDNGSGKTTLLRVLAGLLDATEGELLGVGDYASHNSVALAFLGHTGGLKLNLTASENLRFRVRLSGIRAGVSIASALKSVGLDGLEDTPIRLLSAGQRKRAALATILVAPAALWLLDEPYANLDREGHVLVDRLLETHTLRGGGAIITSHGMQVPTLTKIRRIAMASSYV